MAPPLYGPALMLAGDSFPEHPHVEAALRARLAPLFAGWTGQSELLRQCEEPRFRAHVPHRVGLLDRVAPGEDWVLLGRSSGGRVASLFASRRKVAATICLGYPFRQPGRVIQPERFVHLARASTPTLIVQGEHDRYGGRSITEDYALSPSVQVRFAPCNHEFDLPEAGWDAIADEIAGFCRAVAAGQPPPDAAFDEAHYLAMHADVARAVAAGRFVSGAEHHRLHGRAEGRAHRLLPARPATPGGAG